MGLFDFMLDKPDYTGDFGRPEVARKPGVFTKLFSDENFIRSLGETGAAISGGMPIGQAIGTGASNLVRRRAVQRQGEKTVNQQKTFQERMLDALQDGSLLSPTSDNIGADVITYDGDGNITIKAKKSPPQPTGLVEQKPLEAVVRTEQPVRSAMTDPRQDLRDFSFSQEAAANFAGLDPEDVKMVLDAKQGAGQLTQRAIEIYLNDKYRQQDMKAKQEERMLDREDRVTAARQKQLDKEEDRKFQVEMTLLKDRLGKERDPLEVAKISAEINNLNSQIEERAKGPRIPPAEQQRLDNEATRLKMAQDAVKYTQQKDQIEQQKDILEYEKVINGVNKEGKANINSPAAAPLMDHINQTQNKPYYYHQYVDSGEGLFNLAGDVKGAKIPLVTKAGVRMTMQDVRDSAAANGMTVEEFLASEGIGVLKKGDNDDYQPADR